MAQHIRNWAIKIGGSSLAAGEGTLLARNDLVLLSHIRSVDWSGSIGVNPPIGLNSEVATLAAAGKPLHIYSHSWTSGDASLDSLYPPGYSSLGRYSADKGHSLGDISTDNPNLFLLNASGSKIKWGQGYNAQTRWILDVGSQDALDYIVEAVEADWLGERAWNFGGFYIDNFSNLFSTTWFRDEADVGTTPALYPTQTDWTAARVWFLDNFTDRLAELNTDFMANVGNTPDLTDAGGGMWEDLDQISTPFRILEENFAINTYGAGDTTLLTWSNLQLQKELDAISAMRNLPVCVISKTDVLGMDTSGTTNYTSGSNIYMTGREALWYSLGCAMLAMPRHAILYYTYCTSYDDADQYYDEYDHLYLGVPLNDWQYASTSSTASTTYYWREMERGYVYVNPTVSNRINISLPEPCRPLTPANFTTEDKTTIEAIETFNLNACRAAFFLKVSHTERDVGRPYYDKTAGGWTPSTGDGLYAVLDDKTDDTEARTTSRTAMELRLLEPDDTAGVNQILVRAKSPNRNSITVDLYDDSRLHSPILVATRTFTDVSSDFETLAVNLTSEERAAIIDWSLLTVKITPVAA